MKRTVLGIGIGAVLALSGGAAYGALHSNATAAWPAHCATWRCVNTHLNLLRAHQKQHGAQILALRARNARLRACIAEYPVTRYSGNNTFYYGQDSNGDGNFDTNVYNNNPFRYLDQTNSGDGVSIWILHDNCAAAAFGRPPAP